MTGKALEGVKVLEYASFVMGPYCTKLLADILVEDRPPEVTGELGLTYDSLKLVNPKLIRNWTSLFQNGQ